MEKKKNEKKKEAKINLLILVFFLPIYLARCIQNLKIPALIGAEKSVTENLTGEKEEWTNNGNDKQEEADSLLHNTTSIPNKISKS